MTVSQVFLGYATVVLQGLSNDFKAILNKGEEVFMSF